MCERDSHFQTGAAATIDQRANPKTGAHSGSRRRRLWDLPARSHCPVIGVCVPLPALRKITGRIVGDRLAADDYDIHVGAVVECGKRNPISEAMHKYLEQRYARTVQRFASARTTEAVWEMWAEAVNRGDLASAFWAALTHPRCDEQLEGGLIRDMHMLQHQAGAAVRVDLRKMEALQQQNAALAEELQRLQERSAKQMLAKVAEAERLCDELADARMLVIAKDAACTAAEKRLQALQATMPHLDERLQQEQRLADMKTRQREQEARIDDLERQLVAATKHARAVGIELAKAHVRHAGGEESAATAPPSLQEQTVLCVGGRTGNVPAYRQAIERVGGQFAFHDGGIEDSHGQLEASLVMADMVICQTGCVSHNAYWRVKDYCKRHGKPCVFVDNPSVSSLARSLQQVFAVDRPSD